MIQQKAFHFITALQVRQTAVNVVVGLEVACWFFIGECIGKGSLVRLLLFRLLYHYYPDLVFNLSLSFSFKEPNIFINAANINRLEAEFPLAICVFLIFLTIS